MAAITALSMLDVKIFTEDIIVNVSQDMLEMERSVHVSWIQIMALSSPDTSTIENHSPI